MPSESKDPEHQPFLPYSGDSTTEGSEPDDQYSNGKSRRSVFLSHAVVFIITSLMWTIILFAISSSSSLAPKHLRPTNNTDERHNITSNARLVLCGNSTEEARALGCQYDILLNHWVPAQCVDEEFISEYKEDDSWAAYADEDMTQQLMTIDEMSDRDVYYTSRRDHINHCAIVWRKQFYTIFEDRAAFDSVITMPYHTDHCAQFLMDVTQDDYNGSTKVEVGFAGCWLRD